MLFFLSVCFNIKYNLGIDNPMNSLKYLRSLLLFIYINESTSFNREQKLKTLFIKF